eukprot:CAMPEP_0117673738 /NCGR_PEP_ID=MMETSP0804-20121206/14640_1 /TAXON_ID=1074897 /ORGANISM="Tetraselmis astigmatica, Strain CCMP880" /LENGTH=244 /DNA_ID=CAMNT_0005482511 /DNA_START=137 /DNA_END=872 /DNA_ORIENTATION=+
MRRCQEEATCQIVGQGCLEKGRYLTAGFRLRNACAANGTVLSSTDSKQQHAKGKLRHGALDPSRHGVPVKSAPVDMIGSSVHRDQDGCDEHPTQHWGGHWQPFHTVCHALTGEGTVPPKDSGANHQGTADHHCSLLPNCDRESLDPAFPVSLLIVDIIKISRYTTPRKANTQVVITVHSRSPTAPAAKAPASGDAAMMAATTTFLTAVIRLSKGVYRIVSPAEAAITDRRLRESRRQAATKIAV